VPARKPFESRELDASHGEIIYQYFFKKQSDHNARKEPPSGFSFMINTAFERVQERCFYGRAESDDTLYEYKMTRPEVFSKTFKNRRIVS